MVTRVAIMAAMFALFPGSALAASATVTDPVGDGTGHSDPNSHGCPSGCGDISSVTVELQDTTLVVTVIAADNWGTGFPRVYLLGKDSGPNGGSTVLLEKGSGYMPASATVSQPSASTYVYTVPLKAFDIAPTRIDFQAKSLPGYYQPPKDSPEVQYDTAPDSGYGTLDMPDRDGDGIGDSSDPCPDGAYSDPPLPWYMGQHYGCPATPQPFTGAEFQAAAMKSLDALRGFWAKPPNRAKALAQRSVTVPFRLPGGRGSVSMAVVPARASGPVDASIFGVRTCAAGSCPLALKLVPARVRAYAANPLRLLVQFKTGSGKLTLRIAHSFRLRMPR